MSLNLDNYFRNVAGKFIKEGSIRRDNLYHHIDINQFEGWRAGLIDFYLAEIVFERIYPNMGIIPFNRVFKEKDQWKYEMSVDIKDPRDMTSEIPKKIDGRQAPEWLYKPQLVCEKNKLWNPTDNMKQTILCSLLVGVPVYKMFQALVDRNMVYLSARDVLRRSVQKIREEWLSVEEKSFS